MGRIELKHYPASKLPAEMRGAFVEGDFVNVTIEAAAERTVSRAEILKVLRRHVPSGQDVSIKDAVKRIRELRDEWDQ